MTPHIKFSYIVQFQGETIAGFVHRPDAEHYQEFRCRGLACSADMYPIIDIREEQPPRVWRDSYA